MINIKIDASALRIEGKRIGKMTSEFPKEISASINKALTVGQSYARAKIQAIYNVKGVSLKVNKGGMSGSIEADGPMNPVSNMSPKANESGVSVEIIRGSRKIIGASGKGKGAFMLGDGRVMERRQVEKYPIYPVSTIGTPQMLGAHKVSDPTTEEMEKVVVEELEKRLLGKL